MNPPSEKETTIFYLFRDYVSILLNICCVSKINDDLGLFTETRFVPNWGLPIGRTVL